MTQITEIAFFALYAVYTLYRADAATADGAQDQEHWQQYTGRRSLAMVSEALADLAQVTKEVPRER